MEKRPGGNRRRVNENTSGHFLWKRNRPGPILHCGRLSARNADQDNIKGEAWFQAYFIALKRGKKLSMLT